MCFIYLFSNTDLEIRLKEIRWDYYLSSVSDHKDLRTNQMIEISYFELLQFRVLFT